MLGTRSLCVSASIANYNDASAVGGRADVSAEVHSPIAHRRRCGTNT